MIKHVAVLHLLGSGKISDMTSDHRYFAWLKDILRYSAQNGMPEWQINAL